MFELKPTSELFIRKRLSFCLLFHSAFTGSASAGRHSAHQSQCLQHLLVQGEGSNWLLVVVHPAIIVLWYRTETFDSVSIQMKYACRQMCMLYWPSHRLVMLSERVPVLAFSGQLRGNGGSWLSPYPCSSLGMFPDALSTILHCSQVAEVTSALVPTAFTKVSECFHPW